MDNSETGVPDPLETLSKESLLTRVRHLEEKNRDLMGMMENSYDAMCIVDGTGKILLLNPAFEKVMGFKNSEMIGRRIPDIVDEGLTDTAATVKVLETGQEESVIINTIAGKQVLSTGRPVYDRDGKIFRIYCNLRDVTDLNHLREQYHQSQRLASKYLKELNELKKIHVVQSRFVTRNTKVMQIVGFVYQMAEVDSTVLILGESGVGKDLIARTLHEASPRNETGEFVKVNCGAIPKDLLESEIFGYEPGAFTGAKKEGKIGYFELAHKGTLFLDEIGDLPKGLQVKLLGAIQDHKITRVGSTKEKEVDVRIVAATNRNLEKMMVMGEFREDLYYRLSVIPITIPPLKYRKDDIPFLLIHYLEYFNEKYSKNLSLQKSTIETLSDYSWPGNVRELANLIERLVLSVQKRPIGPNDLPNKYRAVHTGYPSQSMPKKEFTTLKEAVEEFECELVRSTLKRASSLEEASIRLGISLSTLVRKKRKAMVGQK
jgi:PAS domain S-box-containing protein